MMCGPTTLVESIRNGEKSWFLSVSLSVSLSPSFWLSQSPTCASIPRSRLSRRFSSPRPSDAVRACNCVRIERLLSSSLVSGYRRIALSRYSLSLSPRIRDSNSDPRRWLDWEQLRGTTERPLVPTPKRAVSAALGYARPCSAVSATSCRAEEWRSSTIVPHSVHRAQPRLHLPSLSRPFSLFANPAGNSAPRAFSVCWLPHRNCIKHRFLDFNHGSRPSSSPAVFRSANSGINPVLSSVSRENEHLEIFNILEKSFVDENVIVWFSFVSKAKWVKSFSRKEDVSNNIINKW